MSFTVWFKLACDKCGVIDSFHDNGMISRENVDSVGWKVDGGYLCPTCWRTLELRELTVRKKELEVDLQALSERK